MLFSISDSCSFSVTATSDEESGGKNICTSRACNNTHFDLICSIYKRPHELWVFITSMRGKNPFAIRLTMSSFLSSFSPCPFTVLCFCCPPKSQDFSCVMIFLRVKKSEIDSPILDCCTSRRRKFGGGSWRRRRRKRGCPNVHTGRRRT